jgi:hypothetical protein
LRNPNTGLPVLNWNTTTGRLYTIWWSTNVTGTFTRLPGASNLAANVSTFSNALISSMPRAFYRVEVTKP